MVGVPVDVTKGCSANAINKYSLPLALNIELEPLHLKPVDNKSILIELENSGWRFFSNDGLIGVETGLYFGNKNQYIENQNIFISGITQSDEQLIEWQISKI